MKNKLIRVVVILMAFSFLGFLFGCDDNPPTNTEPATNTAPTYPFDTQKAYCYRRTGIIAGSSCTVTVEPSDIVKTYTYTEYPSGEECGMQDNGADIYFEGLRAGEAKVTLMYTYPTMEPEEVTFTLKVSEDLTVTKSD